MSDCQYCISDNQNIDIEWFIMQYLTHINLILLKASYIRKVKHHVNKDIKNYCNRETYDIDGETCKFSAISRVNYVIEETKFNA